MTTTTTDRARLEELLGEYWEIAFDESSGVAATGNKANRVLHEIRALFDALAAPATALNDRLRNESKRKPMTDQDTLDLFNRIQLRMCFTDADARPFASGVASAEFFHGIKDKP